MNGVGQARRYDSARPSPCSGEKYTLCAQKARSRLQASARRRGAGACRENREASNDAGGDATMSLFTWRGKLLACSILATAAAPIAQAVAEEKAAPPDFSSNNVGWVGLNGGGPFYEPVPGRVPPVSQ